MSEIRSPIWAFSGSTLTEVHFTVMLELDLYPIKPAPRANIEHRLTEPIRSPVNAQFKKCCLHSEINYNSFESLPY